MSPVNENLIAPRPTVNTPSKLVLSMVAADTNSSPDDGPDPPKQDS